MNSEIKVAANAISRAPRAFCIFNISRFARGVLMNTWRIITAIEGYNACGFV